MPALIAHCADGSPEGTSVNVLSNQPRSAPSPEACAARRVLRCGPVRANARFGRAEKAAAARSRRATGRATRRMTMLRGRSQPVAILERYLDPSGSKASRGAPVPGRIHIGSLLRRARIEPSRHPNPTSTRKLQIGSDDPKKAYWPSRKPPGSVHLAWPCIRRRQPNRPVPSHPRKGFQAKRQLQR